MIKPRFESSGGFTLIELLVVMAIIGMLASVVISSLNDARLSAKESATIQQLHSIRLAVERLAFDTGKRPNGCPIRVSDPEVALDTNQAGLLTRPTLANNGGGCSWSQVEIDKWKGPYVTEIPQDQFNRPFMYDPDYIPYRNCSSEPEQPVIQAIVSRGVDQAWYTCDDIFLKLE